MSTFDGDPLSWAEMLAGLGPPSPDLDERRARIEGEFAGLAERHSGAHVTAVDTIVDWKDTRRALADGCARQPPEPSGSLAEYARQIRSRYAIPFTSDHGGTMQAPDNPYRRPENVCSTTVGAPIDEHLTLDDIEALLMHRQRHGYATGYRARDELARSQLERAYDAGWYAGALAQHERVEAAFGDRLHALHELLHLVPVLFDPHPAGAELAEIVRATIGSIIDAHGEGLAEPEEREGPSESPWSTLPADAVATVTDERALEDVMRARAIELREWLRHYLQTEPDEELAGTAADRVMRRYRGTGDRVRATNLHGAVGGVPVRDEPQA